jgi:hypothetical protein
MSVIKGKNLRAQRAGVMKESVGTSQQVTDLRGQVAYLPGTGLFGAVYP